MKSRLILIAATLCFGMGVAACGSDDSGTEPGPTGGTAGQAGKAGSSGKGGTAGNGGTAGTGGQAGKGGSAGTGGSAGKGGSAGTGGKGGSAGTGGTAGTAGAGGAANTCGDGTVGGSETCDDGNKTAGDGCSDTCATEDGFTCTGAPSVCTPTCGDGKIKGAEACDDGNTTAADGCSATCTVETGYNCTGEPSVCAPTCGDGKVTGGETCDDSNTTAGDGCDATCVAEHGFTCTGEPSVCATTCGDGVKASTEACDDGNVVAADGCSATCTVDDGYACTGEPSVCAPVCGDSKIVGTEACDDGNTTALDGCSATCTVEAGYLCTGTPSVCTTTCGDGIKAGAEACDDGNTTAADGCSATCTVETGFTCAGVPSVCTGICGDGLIKGAEACDDSNTTAGDGCSATCTVETGYVCTGTPSVCTLVPPGGACSVAKDLTGATFPVALTGTFADDPAVGGSCDTTPTNAVWYKFTAPTTGTWVVSATNNTADDAYSRLAVFGSASCSPLGTELKCVTASGLSVSTTVDLTAGTTYLILFHTDGNAYSMVDPSINLHLAGTAPAESCATAVDVSAVTFPHDQLGSFVGDPATGPTCDTTPTNAVWFKYTPTTTGLYDISATDNSSLFTVGSRLAVFSGAACSPLGTELACVTSTNETAAKQLSLTAGTTYLIMFFTDADATDMTDPTLTIALAPVVGLACTAPADLSAVTFPYVLTGTFSDSTSGLGGTCDTTPTNIVWYSYTATATKTVVITATNATTTSAYSRLSIFQTTACNPHGTEVSCTTASGKSVATSVDVVAGTTYLLAFYTDGATYTMVNPSITIADLPPGALCSTAVNLTGKTFPFVATGTFPNDVGPGGTCDTTPNNIAYFTFTPATTQAYTITAVNASTTLAYSRLAIFQTAACAPHGTEVACTTASGKTITNTVTLTAGTTYLILFHTDGEAYSMVDPSITITP